MLLHWCTLEPSGPSNLAAIRFSSPVRVQSIRVFPTNAKPFALNPEIVARTEPEAFILDVFLNAHPIHPLASNSDSKQKSKPANALIPTTIAYAGGQMDFRVDIGAEYATRLMIIKGDFESVTLAIYGDVASEIPPPPLTYESNPIPSMEPVPLSRALDPSNSSDPTLLARQLLALIADAPPLPLVVRLMLCLKPSNEDWELPEFPYLYSDLDQDTSDFELENVFECTGRPVADDASVDVLKHFADRVATMVRPKDSNQSYLVAGILSHAAPQHPELARNLVEKLDLEEILDPSNVDELTALRLLDAATNADIARHLNSEWFLGLLNDMLSISSVDQETKKVVHKLLDRIRGWEVLEDALSNTQADFQVSANMMKDVGTDEQFFGIWLESMITHEDIVMKLAENPVLPVSQPHPPPLISDPGRAASISHDEFIAFVRAYIGVSGVLAVYAWADSLPNDQCRERTLSVLRLWQGIEGYREIVNHLLLLRQMTFRLECMTSDNDPPTRSGIHAEHILKDLAKEPRSILRRDFVKCILSLGQPLSCITEDERLSMRSVALVADDGLSGALDELLTSNKRPMDLKRLRILRVAVAIVERELSNDDQGGEWRILQALWQERSHDLVSHLLDSFLDVNDDLKDHFTLVPPPPSSQELVTQLFRSADDLLRLMARFFPAFQIPGHSIRILTTAVADVFVCTDAADMLYSQTSAPCAAAQVARQTCIDLIRIVCDSQVHPQPRNPPSEIVLRTLLEHGVRNEDRDPVCHLQQVFCLIDHLLPFSTAESTHTQPSHWITTDIPNVLQDLKTFFQVLDTESKLHLFRRLFGLDQGVIGIGEWLLSEEIKHISEVLPSLQDTTLDPLRRMVQQHQIYLSLHFLQGLITSDTSSAWCVAYIGADHDAAQILSTCMLSSLDCHISSMHLTQIAVAIVADLSSIDSGLRFAATITLLRAAYGQDLSSVTLGSAFTEVQRCLKELSTEFVDIARIRWEIGAVLSVISESPSTLESIDKSAAESILSILEWLSNQEDIHAQTLRGVTGANYDKFLDRMRHLLDSSRVDALGIVPSDDAEPRGVVPLHLPQSMELSMQMIEDLVHPSVPMPSTPKQKPANQDVLGLVTISPPIAVLRSPSVTGLTKTYSKNDFRQLRQTPLARQNTSRLPSTHVDEFELNGSPPSLVSVPANDVFQALSPAFSLP